MRPILLPMMLAACFCATTIALAEQPGWHFSPLPREADRATLGCDREASAANFACLAVRCEDDFSVGVYVHSSRPEGDVGRWEMTIDREDFSPLAEPTGTAYGGRFIEDGAKLRERISQGSFVYLRHADDQEAAFRFIDLTGSLFAIAEALAFCAPRVPADVPKVAPN